MKKKIGLIVTLVLALLCSSSNISAMENNPAFLIADDYIIIDYKKYDLVDNKVIYNGIEYVLEDFNLVSYDADGHETILLLPVEENRIKDEKLIQELNRQVGISSDGATTLSVSAVNCPYFEIVPAGQWNAETPFINVNAPGTTPVAFTHLTIKDIGSTKKIFTVTGIWGDIGGDWYSLDAHKEQDFSKKYYITYGHISTLRYFKFFIGSLYGTPGFTYKLVQNKNALPPSPF